MLQRIKDGDELVLIDDNTIGNKHTEASWGLCTTIWPKEDLFNKNLPFLGAKYRAPGQSCPFDKNPQPSEYGCFYRCRLFSGEVTNREEAIQLYQIKLEEKS